MHKENAFLTLTFDDEHLPGPSLEHRYFQLFIKRLRRYLGKHVKISYYMAGEYGSLNRRPHFHACIFGWSPSDKKYLRTTGSKSRLYVSDILNRLWQYQGFTSVGDVNFESAAYIARYIMAKVTGQAAYEHYEITDTITGQVIQLQPEYNRMSLKTAIGKTWLDKYATDVYPEGEVLVRGHKSLTPKYYDKLLKREDPDAYEQMKLNREQQALDYRLDNTPERLKAKETVTLAKIKSLKRKI